MPHPTKIALVTGANRGIGLETARQLAVQGVTVYLAARKRAAAEQAAVGLSNVLPIQLDVTSAHDRTAAAARIEKDYGRLDILIHNAALAAPEGNLIEHRTSQTAEAELQQVFNTNLFSVLLLTHDLLPLLRKSSAGRIVNLSSTLGSLTLHANEDPSVAHTKRFAYNASKAALNLFTIHLAQELRDTNIKVNSVHPGWVKTELGTDYAPLEVHEGAQTTVTTALLGPQSPTGRFLHLGKEIPW